MASDPTPFPKKGKKKPGKSLLKTCDELFGKIIRHPGVCVSCGGTDVIQCAHGFSRRYRAVRWDVRNAFPLCRAEHMKYTHNPLLWDEWLKERWGDELYEDLRLLALFGRNPNLSEVAAGLREIWNNIESEAA